MKFVFIILTVFCSSFHVFAQDTTLYLSINEEISDKNNFFIKREIKSFRADTLSVIDLSSDGKVLYRGQTLVSNLTTPSPIKVGKAIWYYPNGKIKKEAGFNSQGLMSGQLKEYTEDGKLIKITEFKDGIKSSDFETEYDGQQEIRTFTEDFSDNNSEWILVNTDQGGAEVINGRLVLSSKSNVGMSRYVRLPISSDNYTIQVDINSGKKAAPITGLIYNFKDWDEYSYFVIEDGYFSIGSVKEGITNKEMNQFLSVHINVSGENQLKIYSHDDVTDFSINGNKVYTKKQKSPIKNQYLGAVIGGKGSAEFDDFKVKVFDSKSSSGITDAEIKGTGTGFLVSEDGYFLTNYHVVDNAKLYFLEFNTGLNTGKTFKAELILKDESSDIALLKISDTSFISRPLPYNLSTSLANTGAGVFTLGYPLVFSGLGKEIKFVDGRISSKTGYNGDINAYQISVPVQPGNSGSPLFDEDGNVIGCVNAKVMDADNVSYAIKSLYLINLVQSASVELSSSNEIKDLSIEEKIKVLSNFVGIVKVK